MSFAKIEKVADRFFVGIDWAYTNHQIVIHDSTGKRIGAKTFAHSGPAAEELVHYIDQICGGLSGVVAAIEDPHCVLVKLLKAKGIRVFHLNPRKTDRFRERIEMSGAKDDARDANVIADALRTDRRAFDEVLDIEPLEERLAFAARSRAFLVRESTAITNRLWNILARLYPGALELGEIYEDKWILFVLRELPTPDLAQEQRAKVVINDILKKHLVRRITADEVITMLQASAFPLSSADAENLRLDLSIIVPQLLLIRGQIYELDVLLKKLQEAIAQRDRQNGKEQPDVVLIRSLPGLGNTTAATLLGEASRPLGQRDYLSLRALAGIAPVAVRTGMHGKVQNGSYRNVPVKMRTARNVTLQVSICQAVDAARRIDPHFRDLYRDMKARGKSHGRALRGVADRYLKVLIAVLKRGTPYEKRIECSPTAIAGELQKSTSARLHS